MQRGEGLQRLSRQVLQGWMDWTNSSPHLFNETLEDKGAKWTARTLEGSHQLGGKWMDLQLVSEGHLAAGAEDAGAKSDGPEDIADYCTPRVEAVKVKLPGPGDPSKVTCSLPGPALGTYLSLLPVGLRPQRPQKLDGRRMLPPRSDPKPRMDPPAAISAPSPPEEPPGLLRWSQGFSVWPKIALLQS